MARILSNDFSFNIFSQNVVRFFVYLSCGVCQDVFICVWRCATSFHLTFDGASVLCVCLIGSVLSLRCRSDLAFRRIICIILQVFQSLFVLRFVHYFFAYIRFQIVFVQRRDFFFC